MSSLAMKLLDWIRQDGESAYLRGFTDGAICEAEARLSRWELRYLENVRKARRQGISA